MRRKRRPLVQVLANFQDPSSIGHVARAVATHLSVQLGPECKIACVTGQLPHSVPGTSVGHAPDAEVALYIGFPKQSDTILQAYQQVVGVYVCEGNVISTDWVQRSNRHAAIVVPSHYCKDAFEDSGVEVPVHVCPHGVEPVYQRRPDVPRFSAFTFLAVFAMNPYWPRKGVTELMDAWLAFVARRPGCQLLVKTNPYPELDRWTSTPGVSWITKRYSPNDIAKLYASAHVHVHASRGEGFGLTPLESLACGTPVCLPAHTGILEYVDADRDTIIRTGGLVDVNTFDNPIGRLRDIKAEDVLTAMLEAHDNWEALEKKAHTFDVEQWRWHSALSDLVGILREAATATPVTYIVNNEAQPPLPTPKARNRPALPVVRTGYERRLKLYMNQQQRAAYEQDPTGLGEVVRALGKELPITDKPDGILLAPYNPEHCRFRDLAAHAPVIAYTTFESDRWPEWWVHDLNHCTMVMVPQEWVRKALAASGCTVPIVVVPQSFKRLALVPSEKKRPYTFGFIGVPVLRKNLPMLMESIPDGADLRVHAAWMPHGFAPQAKNFHVSTGKLSNGELMHQFWSKIDCLVVPSAGEGYSMVPREAIAMGLPVIASDIPAHEDIHCTKIAVKQQEPAWYEFCGQRIGHWAMVDKGSLRAKLKAAMAGKLDVPVADQSCPDHSWTEAVETILKAVDRRFVTYSPWEQEGGGIERFSKKLAAAWDGMEHVSDLISLRAFGSLVQWVVVQFEYGLYTEVLLEELAAVKKRHGFKIMSIVHASNELPHNRGINEKLVEFSDRMVLLNPAQSTTFPQGVVAEHPWPEPGEYREATTEHLGNHGNIHPQKGYRHIFETARAMGSTVRIAGKLDKTNVECDRAFAEQIRPAAMDKDDLHLHFVEDDELVGLMGECQALVYPYEPWVNVQASGAVRYAIQFGRPIVCSSHKEYFDLPPCFPRLPLGAPDEAAKVVARVVADGKNMFENQANHARSRSWNWFVSFLQQSAK